MKLDIRLTSMGLPLLFLVVSSVYGNPITRQVETVPENFSLAKKLPELEGLPDELNEDQCSSAKVNEMARGSEETCARIGNIEGYVNLVMSMIPLQIYYENHSDFTDIFKNYDDDLGAAQDHAKLWRNGDSILLGIRQTFELARQFEPAFTKKYIINKERVEVIKANAHKDEMINLTKDQIEYLKAQLEKAEATMTKVQNKSPAILDYFQKTVSELKAEIKDKERALTEDFTLIKELKELQSFLNFVRKDSDRIRTQALKTKEMTENFRGFLEHDKGTFTRHGRVAHATLAALEEETIRNNEALAENKRKQENLERIIEEERKQVQALFKKISHSHEELRKMRRKLLDKISKSRTLKIIGAILTPVIIGAFLLKYASDEEKKYSTLLQNTMAESKFEVDAILKQIENNKAEMRFFQEQMANSARNSDKLRNELSTFVTLDGDLKNMAEKVGTLLVAIDKAIAGVVNIQEVFDDVTTKLTEMIDFAKTAKTEAEQLNARFFIYNELSLLECNWRDVYFKVLNLDDCTKNFEILY
ncbi:uncharacterized protein MCAP_0864-like [Palaemon carinicauda]|uniref:uncharacterized protein MCAP_0864-like n=1 Tax=Palaemon carinicauda TaxID=392227 RepID=UPI0035B69729